MYENARNVNLIAYGVMLLGALAIAGPLWIVISAATQSLSQVNALPFSLLPGSALADNLAAAWTRARLGPALLNSLLVAVIVTLCKIVIAALSAFAIVYFRGRLRHLFFILVFMSLMLPLEIRVAPTYGVASDLLAPIRALWQLLFGTEISVRVNLLNSYSGLMLPLIASATGTFLFRQCFMTIPDEVLEASRIDGASPMRFFFDILMPMSRGNIISLGTILFIYSWNQYLWPRLAVSDPAYQTATVAIRALAPGGDGLPEWHIAMAGTLISMLPPVLVCLVLHRYLVRGLSNSSQ
ncbi:ABC transporter permease subunit [Brenneria populi]|uniref:sn-glycerol-3-phosphate transport system permease protein UgpE n=1 Tax=Brenneria populi TaxID=1505588 RepID=A0ABU6JT82_9GAMM|nr:ABC transporter permease subunit [Brenneria populi Li et al. 2015]